MAIFRGIGGAGDSTTDATLTAVTEQATNAAASASAAASSASAASGSAANASTYASNSLTYSQNSQTSSVASSSAKDAAQAAQAAAEAAYDAFDDRYLGAKASDPATDNDGNALATGALYYDTANSQLKVYTGSAWAAAAVDAAGFLQVLNNLSDLNDAATARTNLGLGTAATTASTDYATAAQGALADSATQPGDNISTLTNDSGFVTPSSTATFTNKSGNISQWTNDSGYLTSETYTGTVTSVAASVPTGLSISGSPITSSGTLAITFTAGYSIPTTTKQSQWDTAYGWGDHSTQNYLNTSSTVDGGTY